MRQDIIGIVNTLIESNAELDIEISPIVAPREIVQYLESLNFKQGEIESNGWDWDYWIPLTKDDKEFMLSGSGYCGNQALSNYIKK